MYRLLSATSLVVLSLFSTACNDAATSAGMSPSTASSTTARSSAGGTDLAVAGGVRQVQMMDACDPESFNAALGEGTCVRNGGVTFENFLALLGAHHSVGGWHFAPGMVNLRVGQTLVATNSGGEEHTFTEVEEFGGGFVPELNDLSGNPVPAPECLALDPDDIIAPGASYTDEEDEEGTELYQCCIHPWMRAVVTARE